jgi:hypothetical protein
MTIAGKPAPALRHEQDGAEQVGLDRQGEARHR